MDLSSQVEILILEDKNEKFSLIKFIGQKYKCIVLNELELVLNFLNDESPFLILINQSLPEINSVDCVKKIIHGNPLSTIITFVSPEERKDGLMSLEYGAFDNLIKKDNFLPVLYFKILLAKDRTRFVREKLREKGVINSCMDQVPHFYYLFGEDLKFNMIKGNWSENADLDLETFHGKPIETLFGNDPMRAEIRDKHFSALKKFKMTLIKVDLKFHVLHLYLFPSPGVQFPGMAFGLAIDISENVEIRLKKLQEKNKLEREFFRSEWSSILVNLEGKVEKMNQQFKAVFNYDTNESIGNDFTFYYEEKHLDNISEKMNLLLTSSDPIKDICIVQRKDGTKFKAEISFKLVMVIFETKILITIKDERINSNLVLAQVENK